MFNGLKKRVTTALQEGRNLSENLTNTYIRQNNSSNTNSTPTTPTSAQQPTSSNFSLHNAFTSLPVFSPPSDANTTDPAAATFASAAISDINPYAGCRHLAAQETAWQELHDGHTDNARLADVLDATIQSLRAHTEKTETAVSDMQRSLLALPAIGRQLTDCRQLLGDVIESSERLATGLLELEDVMEELELQERQLQLSIELAVYRDGKMGDLERVRSELVREHATKRHEHEQRLRNVQLERQAVFQQAFQEDLHSYRTLGTIPKVERTRPDQTVAAPDAVTLEEIVLDAASDDAQKFNEFLNN